jgi:hypothetical protein
VIERTPFRYDFSSVLPMVRVGRDLRLQIIWDLFHYGWPDDLDVFSPAFVTRFVRMARAFAQVYAAEMDEIPYFCPINEISFLAWAGGDSGHLNPYATGRGFELKVHLARAAIEAAEAIWDVLPSARLIHVDPVVHIVADPERPHETDIAEGYRRAQFQGWDLLRGDLCPEIGGHPKYLDILGLNFYPNNEWVYNGPALRRYDPRYRPFREIIAEVQDRYGRPMIVSETGSEHRIRANWFRYVCNEVAAAIDAGHPLYGICLYPIFCHPGWVDDRHCPNGLWDYADAHGHREIYQPLADELAAQQPHFELSEELGV